MTKGLMALVLAVALAVGVATFPRSYEPGRAEADGPDLTLVEDGRLNAKTWSVGRFGGTMTPHGSALLVDAESRGRVLVSRTLPLFDDTCYVLGARVSADRPGLRVDVQDERADRRLAILPIDAGARRSVLPFVSRARRITLLLRVEGAVRATVRAITLQREPNAC